MSMNIDKPLDDVIAEKRKSRAPRRPRGPRNGAPAAGGAAPTAAAPAAGGRAPRNAGPAAAVGAPAHVGDKIIVSNLPTDVDERQIKELFATTVGPVRSVSLSFNAQGQSKGIATVLFKQAEHATSAYTQYNKRLIDGKKALRVEVIVDPSRAAAAQPLTARLGAAPPVNSRAAQSATVSAAGGSATQRGLGAGAGGRRGGGRRGAAAAGGAGGRGPRAPARPKATLESLDAEMSDWQAQVSASAGAGAAAPAAAESA
ncbi:RNA-binding RNA annealing protein [Rhodotorula kratochvilovae]